MDFSPRYTEAGSEAESIASWNRCVEMSSQHWDVRGGVLGVSGGVDSAVVLALAVRAFGPRAAGGATSMPEIESSPESARWAGWYAASSA